MLSKLAIAAGMLVLASTASAQLGSAVIQNQCSNKVYLWTTSNTPGQMVTIAPGSTYKQGYLTNPDGGGISMKLATEPDLSGPITQYEYTVAGNLWYDISNINGFPFMQSGLTLTPSISSCRSLLCSAGVELCTAAYNQPDDNEATAACDASTDTTLVLCSGQKGNNPVALDAASASSSAAPASSSISVAAPSPSSTTSTSATPPPPSPTSSQPLSSSSASTSSPPPPPSSTSTSPPPPPPSTSSSTSISTPPASTSAPAVQSSAPAVTTAAPAPPSAPPMVGGVTTTFVTHVQTVVVEAPAVTEAPDASSADWSFFHHPASLGAFWNGNSEKKREEPAQHQHMPVAHRHHWQRHAEDSK